MKPANFPARKAARQRAAAERNLPRINAMPEFYSAHELEALTRNNAMLVMPLRDVRTKKKRQARGF